jgi:hypothetical protein
MSLVKSELVSQKEKLTEIVGVLDDLLASFTASDAVYKDWALLRFAVIKYQRIIGLAEDLAENASVAYLTTKPIKKLFEDIKGKAKCLTPAIKEEESVTLK